MKYIGKECKSFITKFVKLINGINKYNVESILLLQICKKEDSFQPIIMSKPIDVDIFEYLKTIYSDNEIYNRSLEYMDMSKIKKKIDKLFYTPIIFTSLSSVPLMKIIPEDLLDISLLLPSKYNDLLEFSDSYFLVSDLFKDFIKERVITGVDDELRFYDENDCVYDTSAFIYKNEINKSFDSDFVNKTSPKHFLPYPVNEKLSNNDFVNKTVQRLLTKLNSASVNREIKGIEFVRNDIGIIEDDSIEMQKLMENVKSNGIFDIEDDKHLNKILTFGEFFKIKPKEVIFVSEDKISDIDGISVSITNAGLCLKNKDFVMYIFYKYFNYENENNITTRGVNIE